MKVQIRKIKRLVLRARIIVRRNYVGFFEYLEENGVELSGDYEDHSSTGLPLSDVRNPLNPYNPNNPNR